jgi:hypothetical protein
VNRSDMKVTQCESCGKDVTYATKKPKLCTVCRTTNSTKKPAKKKSTGYSKKPDNKNTQGELIMFKALDKILKGHKYINHGYYSFLLSPKGYPMQLDRYYPDLKLAFEFDGKQHDEYNKYLHRSKANFEYYKQCDRLKEKHCKDNEITLIRIAWNYKITEDALKIDIKKANPELYKNLF